MATYNLKGDISFFLRRRNHMYVLEGFKNDKKLVYRTLGLKDVCGLELEFNISLEISEAKRILHFILQAIENGIELEDNLITSKLTNAPVLVKKITPINKYFQGEKVYRIILSDENYLLPSDKNCDIKYKNQIDEKEIY